MSKKHITYMGAYSVKHWIDKILSQELSLPEFQRNFVWDDERIIGLGNTLKDGGFIPPIILGVHEEKTWVLDGQQRLTSILLLYLWKKVEVKNPREFNFCLFAEKNGNKKELKDLQETLKKNWPSQVKDIDSSPPFEEIQNRFIPYILIYTDTSDEKSGNEQFFADLFININFLQKPLDNRDLSIAIANLVNVKNTIEPLLDFNDKMNSGEFSTFISPRGREKNILEYLALVAEYETKKENSLFYSRKAQGFTQGEINYVKDFLLSFRDSKSSKWTQGVLEKFELDNELERLNRCQELFFDFIEYKNNEDRKARTNIVYQDFYLFSFIYFVYFSDRETCEFEEVLEKIDQEAGSYKSIKMKSARYRNAPNDSKYLIERITKARSLVLNGEQQ